MGRPHPVGARLNPPDTPPPPARELRACRVRVTQAAREHKPPRRDTGLATLAEELKNRCSSAASGTGMRDRTQMCRFTPNGRMWAGAVSVSSAAPTVGAARNWPLPLPTSGPIRWHRGTVEPMTPASGVRVAAVIAAGFGGIVVLAVGLGALAGRLAASGRVFLIAALVAVAAAFVGGLLAEPVLRRWATRPRRGDQPDLGAPASWASVASLEYPPGRPDGHPAARGRAG